MDPTQVFGSGGALLAWVLDNPSHVLLIATFGGMLLLMILEEVWPRQEVTETPVARWLTNWLLAGVNFFLVLWLGLVAGNLVWVQELRPDSGIFGGLHPAIVFVLLLLALEFMLYLLHRIFHRVPLLWRVHAVHHMDTQVDVTTSHRHHVLEVAATSLLLLPLFLLTAVSAEVLACVLFTRLAIVLLSHSNLAIPEALDRWLRLFVVTPDFHRVHHSSERRYTNSNFGTVLPWFDYLFGTAKSVSLEQQATMQWGLEYLREPGDSRLDRLLLLPLRWRRLPAAGVK